MKYIILLMILATSLNTYGKDEKKKVFKKTQEVSFDSADIDGLVRTPDGAYVNPKKGVKFMPLYKVDKAFDRDIKNSVEYTR